MEFHPLLHLQTKLDDFTKTDNKKSKAYLMEQTSTLPYYADQYLQCVEIPYGNQTFSMFVSLNQSLMKMGMGQIFSGGFANISDEDLFVSNIKQKLFIEVNEGGTEAAAVTTTAFYVRGISRAPIIEPVRFFANHPFLFMIREKSTGTILFIGRMDEPR
jgi:serpin B